MTLQQERLLNLQLNVQILSFYFGYNVFDCCRPSVILIFVTTKGYFPICCYCWKILLLFQFDHLLPISLNLFLVSDGKTSLCGTVCKQQYQIFALFFYIKQYYPYVTVLGTKGADQIACITCLINDCREIPLSCAAFRCTCTIECKQVNTLRGFQILHF